MRELSAEARLHFRARSLSRRTGTGLHLVALLARLPSSWLSCSARFRCIRSRAWLRRALEWRDRNARIGKSHAQYARDVDCSRRITVNADRICAHLHALAID
jgi:hypothetical protein